MTTRSIRSFARCATPSLAALLLLAASARAEAPDDVLSAIPAVPPAEKHAFTIEDLLSLRDIDTLSVSPDGAQFAILVRQAAPENNSYRTGWFVGSDREGALVFAGAGGDVSPATDGNVIGELSRRMAQWSPDGVWIAYPVRHHGEMQLWRSRRDGAVREQLTRNAADVRDFAWSEDGRSVYFTAGTPRAQLQARHDAEAGRGYRFDDLRWMSRVISPGFPQRSPEANPPVWVVDVTTKIERPATEVQVRHFEQLRSAGSNQSAEVPRLATAHGMPPVRGSDGSWAWLAPEGNASRVTASLAADGSDPVTCAAPECAGPFLSSFWWSADDKRVIFWNYDRRNGFDPVLYTWSPSTGQVATVVPGSSQRFRDCAMNRDRLFCVRETDTLPGHVAAIDTRSGEITVHADVNPELKNVRFGKVERIEWDVPATVPEAGYAPRATGYILYPPDFDPTRRYPVFIAPYRDGGFPRGDTGDEHPLFAYAASGIVVLNTNFPLPVRKDGSSSTDFMKLLYSAELDFPHLTTLMRSTLRALDLVAQRGFLDRQRVGIGGLSHGSFVPLYMLQKEDRLAAVSIAGGHWNPTQYYASSPIGSPRETEWYPAPFGDGLDWWNRIDIAQHVEQIEAPILFNFADTELFNGLTLLRHMENERKAFDAYVFPNEYHVKWQPAHRQALYRRNLDWFRFWLQDYEDPAPEKQEQYVRWRQLRVLQCKNERSLRDYCGDEAAPIGHSRPPLSSGS